jgi:hypothetical protein
MEIRFRVTGFRAMLLLVGIAGFLGYRFIASRADLHPQASTILRDWIRAEYVRKQAEREDLPLTKKGLLLAQSVDLRFLSLNARGGQDRQIVRVELEPRPNDPPDWPLVRYYRMKYSLILGWTYDRNARPYEYTLALIGL